MRWLHRVVSVGSLVGLSLAGPFGDGNPCRAQQGFNNGVPRLGVPGNRGQAAGPVRGIAPPAIPGPDLSGAFHGQNLPFIFNPAATTANRYPLQPGNPYNPLVMAPTASPGLAATNPFQPPYSPFGVNLFHGTNPFASAPLNPFVLSGLYSPLYNPYLNNPILMAQLNSLMLGQLGMNPNDPLSGGGVPVGNFNNRNQGMNAGVPNLGAGQNMNMGNVGNAGNPGAGN